jgi:hypothetical protein
MSQLVSTVGVVLGITLLFSSGLRAYHHFPENEILGYLRLASQATLGGCLVLYFALGKLRPIHFSAAEIPTRAQLHARPGFAKVGRNPVLAKYL